MRSTTALIVLVCIVNAVIGSTLHFGPSRRIENTANICYGVMMDAGSSSTRAYVFKFECRNSTSTPNVVVTEPIASSSVKPALASYATNPAGAVTGITTLINYAKGIVPVDKQAQAPIYLRATAGMRLIPENQQNAILAQVRQTFKNSTFRFEADSWAKVITGQEESAFNWITINYMNDLLKPGVPASKTRVAMDCGGASVQIAFVPSSPATSDSIAVNVNAQPYNIYAASWLYYGVDQAREATIKLSLPANYTGNGGFVNSPCFHTGYVANVTTFDPALTVVGTGSPSECRTLIRKLLNVTQACPTCSINGSYRPQVPSDADISGVSVFNYAATFVQMPTETNANSLANLTDSFCTLNITEAKAQYGSRTTAEFLPLQCFQNYYAVELLTTAFGIPSNKSISVVATAKNVTLGWQLGALLYDVTTLDCKPNTEICVTIPTPTPTVATTSASPITTTSTTAPTTTAKPNSASQNSFVVVLVMCLLIMLL